jgi:hypothetical protein
MTQKIAISRAMERLFGHPAFRGFALQDRKRLPSRFFARYSGVATGHLR